MSYNFLETSFDLNNVTELPISDKIHPLLLKNNDSEIKKAIEFLNSKEQFLYVHGFLGTGKRQFINYVTSFLQKDVLKLEYYCKESTVCDDILLSFIDTTEKTAQSKAVNLNAKITTLAVKFQAQLASFKKPVVIILHSYDDISDENKSLVVDCFSNVLKNDNIKLIVSTRAMIPAVLGETKFDRKIFLKAFSKDIFREFLSENQLTCTDTTFEDFYKYTRGYYYYTALAVKIIQAMKISLNEFLEKFALSGMSFDSYLGMTYINLIPNTIRNFFWFLRTIRHGITTNALAIFELYDEFSVEYLKSNLMIFMVNETIYVQDYFQQNIDISIPTKTEIKLHKYIISIYEKQLKEPLQTREILISRQALRSEIEFHNECIKNLEQGLKSTPTPEDKQNEATVNKEKPVLPQDVNSKLEEARKLAEENKKTKAIEKYLNILNDEKLDVQTLNEVRLKLAGLYKEIEAYSKAQYYLERVETYYKKNNEVINLSYLYYELTKIYFLMYKTERAIKTIKKVIYSVDTPQSLMVSACTLLGNIYTAQKNTDDAYSYYQKALASMDENTPDETLAELYFKYALASDDRGDEKTAFEYYTKCAVLSNDNPYKSLAYSNMGACYFDNGNLCDARDCLKKAYEIEKNNNDYDGIYYNASQLAEVLVKMHDENALEYLKEAKQAAEFLNEDFYIMEADVALGDFYYNIPAQHKNALKEYFKARKIAELIGEDVREINSRINDMKLRMKNNEFSEIENKYG